MAPPGSVFFRAEIGTASLGPTALKPAPALNAATLLEFGRMRQIAVAAA
jgi:hypothetical protein